MFKKCMTTCDPLPSVQISIKYEDLFPPCGAHVWGHHDPIVTIRCSATSSIYPAFSLSTRKMYCFK